MLGAGADLHHQKIGAAISAGANDVAVQKLARTDVAIGFRHADLVGKDDHHPTVVFLSGVSKKLCDPASIVRSIVGCPAFAIDEHDADVIRIWPPRLPLPPVGEILRQRGRRSQECHGEGQSGHSCYSSTGAPT